MLELLEDRESRMQRLSEVQERLTDFTQSMNEEVNLDELDEEVEDLKEKFLDAKSLINDLRLELKELESSANEKNNEHLVK